MLLEIFRLRRPTAPRRAKPQRSYRPTLEVMEDRQVPAIVAYQAINLVSDQPGQAPIVDPNLVNAWGLAVPPTSGSFWIADNGTGLASVYQGDVAGKPLTRSNPAIAIPGGDPTGVVFNGTKDFVITNAAGIKAPATFLFASESGIISGWSAPMAGTSRGGKAVPVVNLPNAVFKGIAIANNGVANFLYAADFKENNIHVFDTNFTEMMGAGPRAMFVDPNLPAGYAPFNIQNFGGTLYVTYALQDASGEDDVPGVGHGFVDAFDANGNFLSRVASAGPLNSPWGMAVAPANFGQFSNALLVGNFGDGMINAFNPKTGEYLGMITTGTNRPLVVPGLWGMAFGNGTTAGASNTLYFTAGPDDEMHGLFGKITTATSFNDQISMSLIGLHQTGNMALGVVRLHNFGAPLANHPMNLFISNLPPGVKVMNATGSTPDGAFITFTPTGNGRNRDLKVKIAFSMVSGVSLSDLSEVHFDVMATTADRKA
jgi:uncharacterized protein (TIGR03118 family)